MVDKAGKRPRSKEQPKGKRVRSAPTVQNKKARAGVDVDAENDRRMVWRLARVDFGGGWGWGSLDPEHMAQLHGVLASFEDKTPRKLRLDSNLREIPPHDLCREAQERLDELEQEDTDGLAELRLGVSRWRVWGFVAGSTFDVLWWDPDHTVCRELPKGMRRP